MVGMVATCSSAATLPVTMACAETNKLRRKTIDLVFPLGATVNMDGSCIYYVQTVLFLSAMAGYQMTFAQQVQAAVVGALITCGAAPIPGGFIIFICESRASVRILHGSEPGVAARAATRASTTRTRCTTQTARS